MCGCFNPCAERGVGVHGEDGYPYAFPMNYIYLDGKIYFHCAKTGHKLDALSSDDKVSFCVMNEGFRKSGDWALNIKSVVIFGCVKKKILLKQQWKLFAVLV